MSALIIGWFVIAGIPDAWAQVVRSYLNISGGTDPEVESEPSIATLGDKIAVVWFRDSYSVNLRTAVSHDGGLTWADSTVQPRSGEAIYGRGGTCIDNAGRAFCAVYGTDASLGATIFVFSGSFNDAIWRWQRRANAIPFGGEPDGIRIICDRANGTLYLAHTRNGRIQFVRSTDSGDSWTPPLELSGSSSNMAQLALGPEGELYVVWEDYVQKAIVGRKSADRGVSFDPEFTLGNIHDNIGLAPPGWRYSLFRYPPVPNIACTGFPAFLGMAVDTSNGPHRGAIYGVWSEHALGSVDPTPMRTVAELEPNDDFANATPVAIGDDIVGGVPLDDSVGDYDLFTFEGTAGTTIQITGQASECGTPVGCLEIPMSIGLWCEQAPAQWTYLGCSQVYGPSPIPPAIYTLPTTGRYYVSAGATSYLLRLREYAVSPGQAARDHRDVVLVRSTDGGATWSEKVRVNDDAPMYDNAIPAVTVDGSGRVHVAWYDRRDEPECGARVHTYWTWSEDGGVTFQPSRRVSEQPSDAGGQDEQRWQVGDHLALSADGNLVYLLWTQISIGGGDGEILGVMIGDLPMVSMLSAEVQPTEARIVWGVGGFGSFTVYRRREGEDWTALVQRTPDENDRIEFVDREVMQGVRYGYRLGAVVNLDEVFLGEVEVAIPLEPGGINLSWDDCGVAGSALKSFACDGNTGAAFTAVASFVPPPGIVQFTGANAELLIGTDSATLPDWWQHGSGLCRAGAGLAVGYAFAEGPFTCTEVGGGQAAGMFTYEVGYGGVNRARLLVQYVVPEEQVGPLDPATEYYAFKVSLLRSKTTGVGQCAGCGEPACLELSSIQLIQPAAMQYSPVLIHPLDRNFVSWQGTAWTCDVATPVLVSVVAAEVESGQIRVVWQTEDIPVATVYRRGGGGNWVARSQLLPDGSGRMAFVDTDVEPGVQYGYRLGVTIEGREVFLGETEVAVPLAAPLALMSLRRADSATGALIVLTLPSAAPASIEVYDVAGRVWGTQRLEGLTAGRHEVAIAGRQRLSPGVYFVRLAQGGSTTNRRFPLP